MNLVSTMANAARIAEQRHAALLTEAASLDGQASAAKAAAEAKRKKARGMQSILSRLKGACHAIEAADPAILADFGLSSEASAPSAPAVVDVDPAPVVAEAAPNPTIPASDGSAEAWTTVADRNAEYSPYPSGPGSSGLVAAAVEAGSDRDDDGAVAAPIRHVHTNIQKPKTALESCIDRVTKYLLSEAQGDIVSVEWPQVLKHCGSPAMCSKAVKRLQADGWLRKVKSKAPGCATYILKGAASEAAE